MWYGQGAAIYWDAMYGCVSNVIYTNNRDMDDEESNIYTRFDLSPERIKRDINIGKNFKDLQKLIDGTPKNETNTPGTFKDLQKIINDAEDGSTIKLENDYMYNSGFVTSGILINKSLTIKGNGHVIDGLGQSKIFYITSPTVTLNNITFKNGHSKGSVGSAIYFSDTVSDSTISGVFINNTAVYGGAIHFSRGVSNCNISGVFINNAAGSSGGAIYFSKTVSDSRISGEFINNTARNDGAIYFSSSISNYSIINPIILNSIINRGNLEFVNCWFGNTASDYKSEHPYSNCGSWLFLDAFSSPLTSDGKSTVVFTLDNLYNSSSKLVTHPDISDLPDVVFEFSAVNGYLDKYCVHPGESVIFTSTINKDGIVKVLYGGVSYSIPIVNLKLDAPDVNKYYNGSEMFVVTLSDSTHKPVSNINVSITIDGKTTCGVSDNKGQFSEPLDLNPGSYTVTTTARGINVLSTVNIYSTIESEDINAVYKNVTFEAVILDSTGKPVKNGEVKFNIGDLELNATSNENGHVNIEIDMDVGNYIIITTNTATGEIKTNNVHIYKVNSSVTINIETFSNAATLTADISPDNLSGEIVFIINGKNYFNEHVNNSKASINLINLYNGNYTAQVIFNGDSNHNSSVSSLINFNVKTDTILLVNDINITYNETSKLIVELKDISGNAIGDVGVKFVLGNVTKIMSTNSSGMAFISINNIFPGNYTALISFEGNDNYNCANTTANVIVNKIRTEINIKNTTLDIKVNDEVDIGVSLTPADAGNLTYTVSNSSVVKIEDGKIIAISGGDAVITVSFAGDNKYLGV